MRCSTALWPAIRARSLCARERGFAGGRLSRHRHHRHSENRSLVLGETMRRGHRSVVLLMGLALAATALPRIGVVAPLPAAQGENQNALLAKAQAALDAKQWPDAEAALKQLTSSEPRWEYSDALGVAQFNQGHYADSIESYQRAIDLAGKNASPAAIGQMYVTIGNANLKLKKNDAAIAAYTKAAALDPNSALPTSISAQSRSTWANRRRRPFPFATRRSPQIRKRRMPISSKARRCTAREAWTKATSTSCRPAP